MTCEREAQGVTAPASWASAIPTEGCHRERHRQGAVREAADGIRSLSEETVHGERGLYLELSHLPQLQPELGHAPPHVEQARVDRGGAGRRQLAGRRGLHGAESLPTGNLGSY